MNLTAQTNSVSCFGGSNGAINLTVTGGAPPYVSAWSNTATTQDLNSLISGTYTVTVTDANNCTGVQSYIVNQPAPLTFTIVSLSNDCSNEIITGPNFPNSTYQWFGPNGFTSTTAAITANFSGLYTLTITDANGCTATNDYTVNLSGGGACGAITGRVFHDENESCTLNAGEPGLAGWIVRAEGVNDTLYGVTNDQGQYLVGVPVGTYAMKVFVPNGLWTICPGAALATVNMAGDTVSGGDFPVQSTYICPALTVSIGTNQLRRCFLDNSYQVEYCNQGTQKADDAFVTVVLDQYLVVVSVSVPYTDLGANAIKVDVGDLEIGECGMFSIQVFVSCSAQLGQTHCTQASIYPDTLCVPTNSSWSGASLNISSLCDTDSLRFRIQNTGTGGMNGSSGYIVVEDGIMFRSGTLDPLASGASMIIAVPANGSTWRVEVGQELFHPYAAPVGLSVEGCVTTSSFSTGFVNQFPYNDEPPTVDIDCTTNIGSYDPNDKHGYPVGYGADHYIRPGTDIEYLIRFQNTGTDTAFTVQIVDTLSAWLDPATIRFGASSHPYRYDLNGEGSCISFREHSFTRF
ncbi:MAG: SprB repeat-containing protein [Lewinellaceae bacterium]|nr:SprB repeat-containing protein [Lewinellaceae bacterium]